MDRRALKPAIEPLSQRTWQTIETRVFAQLEQPTRPPAPSVGRPTLALGVAGLALAASLLALLQNVVWRPHQQQTAPAKPAAALVAPAAPLQAPHFVTTSGPVEVRLGDSRVRIAEHSDVRVEGSDDEGWRVLLEQGEVSCEVAPREGRPPFVVSAGDVAVRVVGTRFDVTRRAGDTRVQVEASHVQVEHAGVTVLIGPGQSWPASAAPGRTRRPPPAAAPSPAQSALSGRPERPDPQREFERATQLESSDPAQSLAIYQRLSRGRGPWAANSLYARSRLLLDGGQSDAARTLLLRYLHENPAGANAADARRLLQSLAPSAPTVH